MAPPGAEKATPRWPSGVGPREDHVYCGWLVHGSTPGGSRPEGGELRHIHCATLHHRAVLYAKNNRAVHHKEIEQFTGQYITWPVFTMPLRQGNIENQNRYSHLQPHPRRTQHAMSSRCKCRANVRTNAQQRTACTACMHETHKPIDLLLYCCRRMYCLLHSRHNGTLLCRSS